MSLPCVMRQCPGYQVPAFEFTVEGLTVREGEAERRRASVVRQGPSDEMPAPIEVNSSIEMPVVQV